LHQQKRKQKVKVTSLLLNKELHWIKSRQLFVYLYMHYFMLVQINMVPNSHDINY